MAILGIGKKKPEGSKPSALGQAAQVGLGLAALPVAPIVGGGILGKKIYDSLNKGGIKPIKTRREMLEADLNQMRTDPNAFGLTDAEREKYIGDATRAAGASQQAQLSQLSQAALAGTPQAQAQLQSLQQQILGAGDDAAVRAGAEANSLHRQMVDREVARIRSELDAQAERVKENTRYWLNFGFTAAGALIAAATGGGAGIAAAAGSIPSAAAAPAAAAPEVAAAPPSSSGYFSGAAAPPVRPLQAAYQNQLSTVEPLQY